MIAYDTLVAAFVGKSDVAQVQNGGVLHHYPISIPNTGRILHLGMVQDFIVLLPGEGHGRAAAAGSGTGKADIIAENSHGFFGLNHDLGLWEIL